MSSDRGIPGFSAPAAGSEAPLEMLAACHDRVARQLATLRRLVPHLAAHGADDQARSAATAVMRYFDTAAPDHHADEEEDVFPALIESMAGSDAVCLRELVAALTDEHRALESAWRELRVWLAGVADGAPAPPDPAGFDALIAGYERHIAREDAELLPMAARLIGEAELQRIGRAMRARRGIGDAALE